VSRENVEFVRSVYETWNSGDMEAFGQLYDSEAILRPLDDWPEPGPFVGREAIMRQWRHVRESLDVDVVEPVGDFLDAGDRVAVRQAWRGTGHGPDMNMEMTNVFTVRKGKIVHQEFFWDHAEALEALGLRGDDSKPGR
jgi:ketosteroid isomerase-like protein